MRDDPLNAGYYVVLIMKFSSKLCLVDDLTKHDDIYRLCYNVTLKSHLSYYCIHSNFIV